MSSNPFYCVHSGFLCIIKTQRSKGEREKEIWALALSWAERRAARGGRTRTGGRLQVQSQLRRGRESSDEADFAVRLRCPSIHPPTHPPPPPSFFCGDRHRVILRSGQVRAAVCNSSCRRSRCRRRLSFAPVGGVRMPRRQNGRDDGEERGTEGGREADQGRRDEARRQRDPLDAGRQGVQREPGPGQPPALLGGRRFPHHVRRRRPGRHLRL